MLLRDFIKVHMQELLTEHNGLIFGHNLVDVGWVAGTIPPLPDNPNYVDLPITDIAGVGLAVGSSLGNRPVVYISRYHGYLWLNLAPVATYAAASLTVFKQDCWFMMRAIADDGAFGPIASGSLINLALQTKELTVCAPTNTSEWGEIWEYFIENRSPIFVSEHRNSYAREDVQLKNSPADSIVVLSVGGTSILLQEIQNSLAINNISASAYNIFWLRPFRLPAGVAEQIDRAKYIFVLDPGPKSFGLASGIVAELTTSAKIKVFANPDTFSGYAAELRSSVGNTNLIVQSILQIIDPVSTKRNRLWAAFSDYFKYLLKQ